VLNSFNRPVSKVPVQIEFLKNRGLNKTLLKGDLCGFSAGICRSRGVQKILGWLLGTTIFMFYKSLFLKMIRETVETSFTNGNQYFSFARIA